MFWYLNQTHSVWHFLPQSSSLSAFAPGHLPTPERGHEQTLVQLFWERMMKYAWQLTSSLPRPVASIPHTDQDALCGLWTLHPASDRLAGKAHESKNILNPFSCLLACWVTVSFSDSVSDRQRTWGQNNVLVGSRLEREIWRQASCILSPPSANATSKVGVNGKHSRQVKVCTNDTHIPQLLITLAEFQLAPLPWWDSIQHHLQQLRTQEGPAVIFTQWKATTTAKCEDWIRNRHQCWTIHVQVQAISPDYPAFWLTADWATEKKESRVSRW